MDEFKKDIKSINWIYGISFLKVKYGLRK
jgi:hypothetical protein